MHLNTLKMLCTYHKCLLLICGSIQGVQHLLPRGPEHQTMDDNISPRLQENINFGPHKHPQEEVSIDHNFLRSGATDSSVGTLPSSQILSCHDEAKQVIRNLVLQGKDFNVHLDLKVLPLQSSQRPDGWRFHTQPVITFNPGDTEPSHDENCKSTESYLLHQVTDRLGAIQHQTSPVSLASSLM